MEFFKKYKDIKFDDIIQVDGAYSLAHINYGASPEFNKINISDVNITTFESHQFLSQETIEDVYTKRFSFDGTEKDFNSDDRTLLWKIYWYEYINAFEELTETLPNSVVTIYVGRQAIELGFKYLILNKTGEIIKTHDLGKLSEKFFYEYTVNEEYMEWIDVFCEIYCKYIEGNNPEYFKYPEYRGNSFFAGTRLDLNWITYNFILILMKLIHFEENNI